MGSVFHVIQRRTVYSPLFFFVLLHQLHFGFLKGCVFSRVICFGGFCLVNGESMLQIRCYSIWEFRTTRDPYQYLGDSLSLHENSGGRKEPFCLHVTGLILQIRSFSRFEITCMSVHRIRINTHESPGAEKIASFISTADMSLWAWFNGFRIDLAQGRGEGKWFFQLH